MSLTDYLRNSNSKENDLFQLTVLQVSVHHGRKNEVEQSSSCHGSQGTEEMERARLLPAP